MSRQAGRQASLGGNKEKERGRVGEASRVTISIMSIVLHVTAVISVGFYHLGCFIEYLLRLHDGARVFPVHAMW